MHTKMCKQYLNLVPPRLETIDLPLRLLLSALDFPFSSYFVFHRKQTYKIVCTKPWFNLCHKQNHVHKTRVLAHGFMHEQTYKNHSSVRTSTKIERNLVLKR